MENFNSTAKISHWRVAHPKFFGILTFPQRRVPHPFHSFIVERVGTTNLNHRILDPRSPSTGRAGGPHLDLEMWETMNLGRQFLFSNTPDSEDSQVSKTGSGAPKVIGTIWQARQNAAKTVA
jgi:hypothetical protein